MPELKVQVVHELGRAFSGEDMRICFVLDAVPRGGGNRRYMERLGEAFKSHPVMGKHVVKVVVKSSRLRVWVRPTVGLIADVMRITREAQERESLKDQPALFPA